MVADFRRLFQALVDGAVDFVVVGGVALVLHGSARVTRDLDICYARDQANLQRLAQALQLFAPHLRDAPAELPFVLDAAALRSGLNFTLATNAGDVDLLGEIAGVGGYAELNEHAVPISYHGVPIRIMAMDALERSKAAAGRLKDVLDLAELRLLRERQNR